MAKHAQDSSAREREFGVILEDMNGKFDAIMEATAPIPKMQEQIEDILTWKEKVDLIPAIFEEVGELRREVEIIKAAMKLLDRHDARLDNIDQRLKVVEQRVQP